MLRDIRPRQSCRNSCRRFWHGLALIPAPDCHECRSASWHMKVRNEPNHQAIGKAWRWAGPSGRQIRSKSLPKIWMFTDFANPGSRLGRDDLHAESVGPSFSGLHLGPLHGEIVAYKDAGVRRVCTSTGSRGVGDV